AGSHHLVLRPALLAAAEIRAFARLLEDLDARKRLAVVADELERSGHRPRCWRAARDASTRGTAQLPLFANLPFIFRKRCSRTCASVSRARAFRTSRRSSRGPRARASTTCAAWCRAGRTTSTGV